MINGNKGRARYLAGVKKRRREEAAAAGIDPNDRKAVDEFHLRKLEEIGKRLSGKAD